MKGEPVRREEKQFSLMIQQALVGVPVCPLSGTWARWQHRVTGTITVLQACPREHFLLRVWWREGQPRLSREGCYSPWKKG